MSTLTMFRLNSDRHGQHFFGASRQLPPAFCFSMLVLQFFQDHYFYKLRICLNTLVVFRLGSSKRCQHFFSRGRATLPILFSFFSRSLFYKLRICLTTLVVFRLDSGKQGQSFFWTVAQLSPAVLF